MHNRNGALPRLCEWRSHTDEMPKQKDKKMSTFKQRQEARYLIYKFDQATGLRDEQRHFQLKMSKRDQGKHQTAISNSVRSFIADKLKEREIENKK